MIDFISTDDLRNLVEETEQYCVSVYLPTHSSGKETTQDPIRLKNLLNDARVELETLGMGRRDVDRLLSGADALRDDVEFWTTMELGLAVFITPDRTRTYRLPQPAVELAVVAEHFHLKPLLSSVTTDDEFHLLAVSQNQVRLLHGNRFTATELPLGEIPASLDEALALDDRESQLQSHGGGRTEGGAVIAVFHGQGAGKDIDKSDLERFLTAVDQGFREAVGSSTAPLVLAGAESLVGHYRKHSGYPHIVDGDIRGNPERMSTDELHKQAWPLVEPTFGTARRAVLAAVAVRLRADPQLAHADRRERGGRPGRITDRPAGRATVGHVQSGGSDRHRTR